MAIAVRPTHLAGVIFLALHHHLPPTARLCATAGAGLGRRTANGTGSRRRLRPPPTRVCLLRPSSRSTVDPLRRPLAAPPRRHGRRAPGRARRSYPSLRNVCHKRPSSADIIAPAGPAPCGVTAAASKTKAIADALPLLAVPFLPPPVAAALVALSFLAAPVRAWSDCSKLTHATCALYKFDNETGTIDRRRPDPTVNAKCEHPLRHADAYKRAAVHAQEHGRGDDPLLIYCSFHVLKRPPSILPWLNEDITHMPIADPDAVAASGDRVCYVELTHLGYREGYYIRCPSPYSEGRVLTCMEFPEEEIVAAVWEHRRFNYRDTVWPRYVTPAATEKHAAADEL